MSPEAQTIAIAQLCGWRAKQWQSGVWVCYSPDGERQGFAGTGEAAILLHCPDYPNDLNAMRDAESVLDLQKYDQWVEAICAIAIRNEETNRDLALALAYPDERAEALLRTLGKWEDGK